jgi:hypothetical protein
VLGQDAAYAHYKARREFLVALIPLAERVELGLVSVLVAGVNHFTFLAISVTSDKMIFSVVCVSISQSTSIPSSHLLNEGKSDILKWKQFLSLTGGSLSFYSRSVNASPGTSSSVTSFPSSPLESVLAVGGRLRHDGQGGEGLSKACLDSQRTPLCGSCPGITSNVGGHDGPGGDTTTLMSDLFVADRTKIDLLLQYNSTIIHSPRLSSEGQFVLETIPMTRKNNYCNAAVDGLCCPGM